MGAVAGTIFLGIVDTWRLFFGPSDFCTFKTMDLAVFLDEFLSLHLFARGKSLQILHLDLVLRFS